MKPANIVIALLFIGLLVTKSALVATNAEFDLVLRAGALAAALVYGWLILLAIRGNLFAEYILAALMFLSGLVGLIATVPPLQNGAFITALIFGTLGTLFSLGGFLIFKDRRRRSKAQPK